MLVALSWWAWVEALAGFARSWKNFLLLGDLFLPGEVGRGGGSGCGCGAGLRC